jgi:hypothetical protein
MGSRIVDGLVALAVLLSAAALVLLFARPFLWPPTPAAVPTSPPSPSASAVPEGQPPVGLFELRGRLAFSGPCLGIELTAESYPSAPEETGSARVVWWTPTAIDAGNPAACASRSSDLNETTATLEPATDGDDPTAPVVGYSVTFAVPVFEESAPSTAELVILLNRSTNAQLQALVISPEGSPGVVFDRVDAIAPPFEARPSAAPTVVVPPMGIFLLQGTIADDGPCLVVELGFPSYPVGVGAEGVAGVRSWEPANRDPEDPARCLMRRSDVVDTEAAVIPTRDAFGAVTAYEVGFSLPPVGDGAPLQVRFSFDPAVQALDQLVAALLEPATGAALSFDRVDAIDPPPAP